MGLGVAVAPVVAQTVFRVTGTVSVVGTNLGSTVTVGDAFVMDFTLDETQAPWLTNATQSLYNLQLSSLDITTVGSGVLTWALSTPAGNDFNHGFSVENNSGRDALILNGSVTGPSLNGKVVVGYVFSFLDGTQTAFSATMIPTVLDVSWFNSQLLDLRFDGNVPGADIINFNATSLEVNPSSVPEPAAAAAWGAVLVCGWTIWRRRHRASRSV